MIAAGSLQLIEYVQRSGDVTYFLAVLYGLTFLVSARKLFLLHRTLRGRWEAGTIFLASIVFASTVRLLSYTTLCILSFKSVKLNANWASQDDDGGRAVVTTTHAAFYTRVLEVLFNVGDFVFLTAYMMLVVLWAECYRQAKRHMYSTASMKRNYMTAYLVTLITLYVLLIALYSAFLASTTETRQILNAIYVFLGFIDLAVPLILVLFWCCMTVIYSGFPARSAVFVKQWNHINRVITAWSVGRIAWGVASIVAAAVNWASAASTWQFSIALVSLALVAEVFPFMYAPTVDTTEPGMESPLNPRAMYVPLTDGPLGHKDVV